MSPEENGITWEQLCAESDAKTAKRRELQDSERWTGATVTKTSFLNAHFKFSGIRVHPDAFIQGSWRHNLVQQYLQARIAGQSVEEAFAQIAFPNQPAVLTQNFHFWAENISSDPQTDAQKVAAVGENLLYYLRAHNLDPRQIKFNQTRSTKVTSFTGKPAGAISYEFDILIGNRPLEIKFADRFYPQDLADMTVALMIFCCRGGTLNQTKLPPEPLSCLVFPNGIQTARFPKEGRAIREQIVTTCLRLLSADFNNPGIIGDRGKSRQTVTGWNQSLPGF